MYGVHSRSGVTHGPHGMLAPAGNPSNAQATTLLSGSLEVTSQGSIWSKNVCSYLFSGVA